MTAFLEKLRRICSTCPSKLAGWSQDGLQFEVRSKEFELFLKGYFKGTLKTFIRQLHFYGFTKSETVEGKWTFSHPKFNKSNPDAVLEITRKTRMNSVSFATKEEVDKIRKELGSIKETLTSEVSRVNRQLEEIMGLLVTRGSKDAMVNDVGGSMKYDSGHNQLDGVKHNRNEFPTNEFFANHYQINHTFPENDFYIPGSSSTPATSVALSESESGISRLHDFLPAKRKLATSTRETCGDKSLSFGANHRKITKVAPLSLNLSLGSNKRSKQDSGHSSTEMLTSTDIFNRKVKSLADKKVLEENLDFKFEGFALPIDDMSYDLFPGPEIGKSELSENK